MNEKMNQWINQSINPGDGYLLNGIYLTSGTESFEDPGAVSWGV